MKSISFQLTGRSRRVVIAVGLCLLLAVVVMAGAQIGPFAHDVMYVPEYPNAQDVQVVVYSDPRIDPYASIHDPHKVVVFTTTDSSEQVFAFFKDKMLIRPLENWDLFTEEPNFFEFICHVPARFFFPAGGLMHTLSVTTEERDGLTQVRVEGYYLPGM